MKMLSPILCFFLLSAGAPAQTQPPAAGSDQPLTLQEAVFQVISAFLNELLAEENVRVAKSAVEMTKSDLKRVHARQESGVAVPSDLLSAQVQLAQAEEDLLRAQNAVQSALPCLSGLDEVGRGVANHLGTLPLSSSTSLNSAAGRVCRWRKPSWTPERCASGLCS